MKLARKRQTKLSLDWSAQAGRLPLACPRGSTNTKQGTRIFCLLAPQTPHQEARILVYPDSTDSKQGAPLHPFTPSPLHPFSAL
jgi:hypothetical protein